MIRTDDRPPADVLMDSLSDVEGAEQVVILLQKPESLIVKTNCSYKELHWILSQAQHVALNELFEVKTRSDE